MQRPTALGLFLCEQVIIDRESGLRTLVGLFDARVCRAFPCPSLPFTVYAALTDGQGRIDLGLSVTDIDDEVELANESLTLQLPDPLAIAHVRFRFRSLLFPEAGQYLFQLYAQGSALCHRRLHIQAAEEEP